VAAKRLPQCDLPARNSRRKKEGKNQLPDEAIERIARGEHIMSVLASMVPRAGEAVPGLLAPQEEETE
jgi:hypothetical protein